MRTKKKEETNEMKAQEFKKALDFIVKEKGIDEDVVIEAMQTALSTAFRKNEKADYTSRVLIDRNTGEIKVFKVTTIVDDYNDDDDDIDPETGEVKVAHDYLNELTISEAKEKNSDYQVGDEILEEVTPKDFGRVAISVAKQVVLQKIREAEREIVFTEYSDRQGEIVSGLIQKVDKNVIIVDLGRLEGIMTATEQVPTENYAVNDKIKAYVVDVQKNSKGVPQMMISRTHPGFVKRLFELEIPEIYEGLIEIKNIVREAGSRTKIAVYSKDMNIDPVGSCVGPRGIRIQNILNELKEEKIDVVEWSEDPVQFIASALSPATVLAVDINEEEMTSKVVVPDSQLSLAIGKDGQNARLSAKLTGWKVDIKSESQIKAGE